VEDANLPGISPSSPASLQMLHHDVVVGVKRENWWERPAVAVTGMLMCANYHHRQPRDAAHTRAFLAVTLRFGARHPPCRRS
jgi:hypothetical protein